MEFESGPDKPLRLRVGGPCKVLLAAEAAPLLLRMAEMLREFPGVRAVGAFRTAQEAIDWAVWDRQGWDLAFVDLALPDGGGEELVRYLLGQPRPGEVVALGEHLWREVREACAALGVRQLLEKGDLVALRDFLEQRLR